MLIKELVSMKVMKLLYKDALQEPYFAQHLAAIQNKSMDAHPSRKTIEDTLRAYITS